MLQMMNIVIFQHYIYVGDLIKNGNSASQFYYLHVVRVLSPEVSNGTQCSMSTLFHIYSILDL